MNEPAEKRIRDASMDAMKGFLTVCMILAHIVQFFPGGRVLYWLSSYVDLVTFSGFLFAFGYVCELAYVERDLEETAFRNKMLRNFLKTLLAFYCSGIAYTVLVERDWSAKSLLKILALWKMPGYSEFLVSFALLYLLLLVFRGFIRRMTLRTLLVSVAVSLAATFLPYERVQIPPLGVLIGTTAYSSYPVLQYASYFLAGAYLAKRKKVFDWRLLLAAAATTAATVVYLLLNRRLPARFPPSCLWIVGGYLFVYGYYLLAKGLRPNRVTDFFAAIGAHTLVYLVFSNIVLFFAYAMVNRFQLYVGGVGKDFLYIGLCAVCLGVPYGFFRCRADKTRRKEA